MPGDKKKIGKKGTGVIDEDDEQAGHMTAGAFIHAGHVTMSRQSRNSRMADIKRHERLLIILFGRDRNVLRQDDGEC